MIIAQITVVTYILKNRCSGALYSMAVAIFGIFAMLFWQFSQFAFFTQVGSLFVVYTFDFIPRKTMETLISAHLVCSSLDILRKVRLVLPGLLRVQMIHAKYTLGSQTLWVFAVSVET
ncbi:hypothetical protein ANCCAN_11232 [Ancylostoma caninum]|uniref:Uncharacterized protein n=1 Tax=Ancylostoma caninum TaxID=29170 RepID=A0A368GHS0_ANCCA|nr:hypothetical protein ANCCAN_11232 [Ancylostoma caninum]